MQLADADYNSIIRPSDFISQGKRLAQTIDSPPENELVFSLYLHNAGDLFPKLQAAFNESKKPLKKRSKDERLQLKQALLEDVRRNMAAAKEQFEGEKLLDTETLPSDPERCIERLEKMEDGLNEQLFALQRKIRSIQYAMGALERMKSSQRELEGFDESAYTSTPQDPVQPLKKKARSS